MRAFKYIARTKNERLRLNLDEARRYGTLRFEHFADADYGNDLDDGKSVSGFALFLCGQLVSAKSWKQQQVSESICEAELIAINDGLHDLLWGEQVLDELQLTRASSIVYCDNQAALTLLKHPGKHRRTKHFAIKYLKNREVIQQRGVQARHVGSNNNVADINTKPLPRPAFERLKRQLGVTEHHLKHQD